MSDIINQVFNLDSTSVDVLNQKLERTYALMMMVSQAGAGGTGGGNGAVDVAKANEKFASRTGFIPNKNIEYMSALNSGLLGADGHPISKSEYSISQYGERQQGILNRRATQEELSSISLSRDVGYLDRRGLSGVDNRVDAAAGKALLYEIDDQQRLARQANRSAVSDINRSYITDSMGLSGNASDTDIANLKNKISRVRLNDQAYEAGLPDGSPMREVIVAQSNLRRDRFDERERNKESRDEIRGDNRDRAINNLGLPGDASDRTINQARNSIADLNADMRAKRAEDRAAVAEVRRANTLSGLGLDPADDINDVGIEQMKGARAEARDARSAIRAEEKRVADVKVVNRGYTARGMTSALIPDDADPDEVYAAQQDIRGMGPVPKTGAAGKVQNAWDKFQGTYGGRFARGALYAAGSSAAEYAHAMENEQMTGRPDYLSRGNAGGSAIGGIIGASIGSLFPGYGTFIGAGVGMQLGGTIGQWSQVKNQQDMMTSLALQPTSAMVNNLLGQFGTGPTIHHGWSNGGPSYTQDNQVYSNVVNPNFSLQKEMTDKSNAQRDQIGADYWASGKNIFGQPDFDRNMSTVEGMAAGYQTVYQSMINAGENPYDYTDFPSEGTTPVQFGTRRVQKKDASGRPITHRGGHWSTADSHTYGTQHNTGTTYQQTYDRTVNPGMDNRTVPTGGPLGNRATDVARQSRNQRSSLVQKAGDANWQWDSALAINDPDHDSVSQVSSNGTNETVGWNKVWIEEDVPEYEDVPIYRNEKTGTRARKGDWIRENAAKWFGAGSDELLKKVYAPINDAKNKTGDNFVDIITQFGGSNAALYSQIKTPFGDKPELDLKTAIEFGSGLQKNDRAMEIAQLSIRDSGRFMLSAAQARMDSMVDPATGAELIPGARSSLEYAKSRQGLVSAQNKDWQEQDFGGYNTAAMRLQNQERRYEVNPYSPGNRMALELTGLGMDRSRIKDLRGREESLRSRGLLSESQQFDFDSQIEGLETNRQERIGHLVEGVANRLPSMSAGRPSFGNRIDSRQMTAMQFGMIDFPYRGAGAMNDGQRRAQETFLEQFLDPSEVNSRSRTFTLNNHGGIGGNTNTKSGSVSFPFNASGMNGGNISSHDVTTVSSPDVVSAIQMLTQALLSGAKGGLAGSGGLGNLIDRSTPPPRGR